MFSQNAENILFNEIQEILNQLIIHTVLEHNGSEPNRNMMKCSSISVSEVPKQKKMSQSSNVHDFDT